MRYEVRVFYRCEGIDKNGRAIRRWRYTCRRRFHLKSDALKYVKLYSQWYNEKATIRRV